MNPIITSIAKYTHAIGSLFTALNAKMKYKSAWIGRRLFHHILSPNTSVPVFLEPVKYMYVNPIAGINAVYPMSGKYWEGAYFEINTNNALVPMHPIRNNVNLF